jgi:ribosomal protein L4
LPKKVRALALASVLSHKIKNNGLCVLSEGSFEKLNFSKTKDVNRTRDIFIKTGRDKIVFIYDQIDSEQTKGCRLADFTYMLDVNALNVKSLCECFIVCKNESILYKIQDLLKIRLAGVK